jgi:predicted Rossmann-fold nucleotide-binding protein
MLALLDHMAEEGFIHTAHRVKPLVVDSAERIVPAIMAAASADQTPTEGQGSVIDKM